jgi:hypothetical protein
MQVWKYLLKVTNLQDIDIPIGGQILDLQLYGKEPCLWVLVNENSMTEIRTFCTYCTGQSICFSGTYIGTYQYRQKPNVPVMTYHVFEVVKGMKRVCTEPRFRKYG